MGGQKIVVIGLSTEENWQQVLWPLTTGNKDIKHSLCSVLTHFVDFYMNFTLRQWTGSVERARIIFSHDDWGEQPGAGQRAQGPQPPCWRRPWCGTASKQVLYSTVLRNECRINLNIKDVTRTLLCKSELYFNLILRNRHGYKSTMLLNSVSMLQQH